VPGIKALMDAYGYYGGPCRLPLADVTEEDIKEIKQTFDEHGFVWPNLTPQNFKFSFPMSS
jgi:dihydrodipicolinate synthase/N-acetylneuraminate lyase